MKGTPQDLFTGASVAESAQERRATLARNQKERVMAALRDAHPHAISHAEICARIGSNRASHRIRELIREGWLIEGAGALGLDPANQTQRYRLTSLSPGKPQLKHLGLRVVWDEEAGLEVSLHRDINGMIDRATLEVLARRVEALVQAELGERLADEPEEEEDEDTAAAEAVSPRSG